MKMSNWTHVAGIIRVDDLAKCLGEPPLNFTELIGKEVTYDDWEDVDKNPDKYLPYGSEGSLKMIVWENPDKIALCSYTVSIFGDLRDHDNAEEIVEWFKKKCAKFDVRNATITAWNERYGTVNWTYNGVNND